MRISTVFCVGLSWTGLVVVGNLPCLVSGGLVASANTDTVCTLKAPAIINPNNYATCTAEKENMPAGTRVWSLEAVSITEARSFFSLAAATTAEIELKDEEYCYSQSGDSTPRSSNFPDRNHGSSNTSSSHLAAIAMTLLVTAVLLCTTLTHAYPVTKTTSYELQFDGSFRPPRDVGFPTSLLDRVGTAASFVRRIVTVSTDDGKDKNEKKDSKSNKGTNEKTVQDRSWLGGRAFPKASLENSAQAEYEGLLLGLEKMVSLAQEDEASKTKDSRSDEDIITETTILIRGDCKTVIDQMRESSRPRKLESEYNRAQELLQELFRCCQQEQQQLPYPSIDIDYQLVPREQNTLCDGLCEQIRSKLLEPTAYGAVRDAILRRDDTVSWTGIKDWGLIPYSKRPALYQLLAQTTLQQNKDEDKDEDTANYSLLLQLGEHMEEEGKLMLVSQQNMPSAEFGKRLQAQGVMYQLHSLNKMATTMVKSQKKYQKLALAKERKNRFLLERYGWNQRDCAKVEQLMQICDPTTNSMNLEKRDEGEEADELPSDQEKLERGLWNSWIKMAAVSAIWKQEKCLWINSNDCASTYSKTL